MLGRSAAAGSRPEGDGVEQRACYDVPGPGQKQRRKVPDPDADGQVGRSPDHVYDSQRDPAQDSAAGIECGADVGHILILDPRGSARQPLKPQLFIDTYPASTSSP